MEASRSQTNIESNSEIEGKGMANGFRICTLIFRRLAALAFPKVERKARESIACDHFLDALDDPELALKIRERQPSDLDLAL